MLMSENILIMGRNVEAILAGHGTVVNGLLELLRDAVPTAEVI
jgi:hypothetical protein